MSEKLPNRKKRFKRIFLKEQKKNTEKQELVKPFFKQINKLIKYIDNHSKDYSAVSIFYREFRNFIVKNNRITKEEVNDMFSLKVKELIKKQNKFGDILLNKVILKEFRSLGLISKMEFKVKLNSILFREAISEVLLEDNIESVSITNYSLVLSQLEEKGVCCKDIKDKPVKEILVFLNRMFSNLILQKSTSAIN